jgi:phosphopantothenoylcysteine decarboxylase/phosphopantothenate--cysteine ligase
MQDEGKGSRQGRVLVVVTGCIAAYKAAEVLRGLQKADCDVRVAMTEHATEFVGPITFEALSGHPVVTDLFRASTPIPHIELTDWAELVCVVPATANFLAKMAAGIADDAASTTVLAAGCPVLVAPAMNVRMWSNPQTQANLDILRSSGVDVVMPVAGRLACGAEGEGKLASVEQVVAAALETLRPEPDLSGRAFLVTAGPTHEAIDPVRFLANASSGKMGYAIAAAAARHGARVVLVSGPTALACPPGVDRVDVTSAAEMLEASKAAFASADCAILAAAVADYTPAHPADHKLKKDAEPLGSIELVQTADILRTLSAEKGGRVVIGFAAETGDAVAKAQAKLARKGCDLIVANDVSREDSAFGSDTDAVTFVSIEGVEPLPTLAKQQVAERLIARAAALLEA